MAPISVDVAKRKIRALGLGAELAYKQINNNL